MKKFKIPYIKLLPIILISFIMFKLINGANISFSAALSFIYGSVAYFVWGLVIAYLFNPAMKFFERLIISKKDSEKMRKIKRGAVIAFLYILLFGIITIFIVALVPIIRDGISQIAERIPVYINTLENLVTKLTGDSDMQLKSFITEYIESISDMLSRWLRSIDLNSVGTHIGTAVTGSATVVLRLFFGLVIAIYFLYSKETILLELKKLIYSIFSISKASHIMKTSSKVNLIFMNFVSSKVLQSAILFAVGVVALNIMKIPLATFLALIIAITNLIPYFGPYIGAIPSVIITLMFDPRKAIWVIIYAIAIQILDNLLIGPKIMSDQVGVSPLLVMAGVTIGGAFFGIIGMFIGVPLAAIIKLVFYDEFIARRLKEKDINPQKM